MELKCPKCGKGAFGNNPRYCPGFLATDLCKDPKYSQGDEHLHFVCVVCGYERTEPCRDAEKVANP